MYKGVVANPLWGFSEYFPRFCETIIIFVERKGYNFKEWQSTSLYLNSKIDKSKSNMAVFYPLADTARLLEVIALINKTKQTKTEQKNQDTSAQTAP